MFAPIKSPTTLPQSNSPAAFLPIILVPPKMADAAAASTVNEQLIPPSLRGRVAIVTGSSRGIGRAIALHLASLGAKVVVNYTANSAQAEAVAAEINSSAPGSAIMVRADVSDPGHVKSLFDAAEEAFGSPIHILVNSAAIADAKYSTIADISVEEFDRIFRFFTISHIFVNSNSVIERT